MYGQTNAQGGGTLLENRVSALESILNATTSVTDLNNATETGFYTTTSTAANVPSGLNSIGALIVLKKSNTFSTQILIANNSEMYFRVQFSTGWQPWLKVTKTTVS